MNTRRTAFTLVEVLVTVLIVTLLAGIILPAIQRKKCKERATIAFGKISEKGLVEAQELYATDYVKWGEEQGMWTPEQIEDEQRTYLQNTAMSALVKIHSEGYENLPIEEQEALRAAIGMRWIEKSEIESRQANYLKNCTRELEAKIRELQEEKASVESKSSDI
jgi:prepilin-type N-terminal cleavage/methylation domain-containing protein